MKKPSEKFYCSKLELCKNLFHWFRNRTLAKRQFRFAVVGSLATGSYFLLGLLFVNLLGLQTFVGNTLAYLLSFIISYLGQSLWTFEARGPHGAMLLRFALAQLLGLLINSCIVGLCMRMGAPYMLSMLVAIIVVPVIVYLICKYWVFRPKTS